MYIQILPSTLETHDLVSICGARSRDLQLFTPPQKEQIYRMQHFQSFIPPNNTLLKQLWYKFKLSVFLKKVIIPSGIKVIKIAL